MLQQNEAEQDVRNITNAISKQFGSAITTEHLVFLCEDILEWAHVTQTHPIHQTAAELLKNTEKHDAISA